MIFRGINSEYFETVTISMANKHLLESAEPSELMLLWFESDDNVLTIDNVDYQFRQNHVLCLTEFHKVDVKQIGQAKLIKWNKHFYCIINHDSEVGCKGILFYGAVELPVILPSKTDIALINTVWQSLEQEMTLTDSMQAEMLQMTLKKLLILCTRIYKNQINLNELDTTHLDLVRQYHFLVETHFKVKHTVAEYAELMHKAPKTLSNTFKKMGSKSPLQYIKDRKMLEARRLLTYTDLSVSNIGYELGFTDVQSFSRFFKREEGVSPLYFKG